VAVDQVVETTKEAALVLPKLLAAMEPVMALPKLVEAAAEALPCLMQRL